MPSSKKHLLDGREKCLVVGPKGGREKLVQVKPVSWCDSAASSTALPLRAPGWEPEFASFYSITGGCRRTADSAADGARADESGENLLSGEKTAPGRGFQGRDSVRRYAPSGVKRAPERELSAGIPYKRAPWAPPGAERAACQTAGGRRHHRPLLPASIKDVRQPPWRQEEPVKLNVRRTVLIGFAVVLHRARSGRCTTV